MTRDSLNRLVQTTSSESLAERMSSQRFRNKGGVVRRSRIERYLDILKVVARHGPIKQTHIMYKANLSWMELKRSLEHLTKSKMITAIDDSSGLLYAISETGLSTIYNYEKVEKILTGKDDQTILTGSIERSASPWNF